MTCYCCRVIKSPQQRCLRVKYRQSVTIAEEVSTLRERRTAWHTCIACRVYFWCYSATCAVIWTWYLFDMFLTKKVDRIYSCVRDLLGSNPRQNTDYRDSYCCLPSVLPGKCRDNSTDQATTASTHIISNSLLENCSLPGYYATRSGNFLPTFRDNLSVPSLGFMLLDSWTPKMGPIGCPETSVRNYHYALRNNPAGRSSQRKPEITQIQYSFTALPCDAVRFEMPNSVVRWTILTGKK
jgi:hypothetical protein